MNTLEFGKYYHIFNRGNNREDLFRSDENCGCFLKLYEKYISPVADTLAWVLMKNHFHLLVRIKEDGEMDYLPLIDPSMSNDSSMTNDPSMSNDHGRSFNGKTFQGPEDLEASGSRKQKKPVPSHQFAHLFNAYTKYYNKKFYCTGSLFEKNFKRIEITSEHYLRQLVIYIHTNPVHHMVMVDFSSFSWSSYQSLISAQPSIIKREHVMEWFGDRDNLIYLHDQKLEIELMENLWLE